MSSGFKFTFLLSTASSLKTNFEQIRNAISIGSSELFGDFSTPKTAPKYMYMRRPQQQKPEMEEQRRDCSSF